MPLSMAIDARRSSEDGTSTHLSTSIILIVLVRIENHAHHIFSLIIGYLEKFISSSAALQGTSPTPIRLPTVAQQSFEPCVRYVIAIIYGYADSYGEGNIHIDLQETTLQKAARLTSIAQKFLHSNY